MGFLYDLFFKSNSDNSKNKKKSSSWFTNSNKTNIKSIFVR